MVGENFLRYIFLTTKESCYRKASRLICVKDKEVCDNGIRNKVVPRSDSRPLDGVFFYI